jgi:polyisoprenoid-binding protein YceI
LNPKAVGASSFEITLPADTVSTSNTRPDGELNGPEWFDDAR